MKAITIWLTLILPILQTAYKENYQILPDPYFKFDSVIHLRMDYKKYDSQYGSLYELARKKEKTQHEKDIVDILLSRDSKLSDTTLISNPATLGFDLQTIDDGQFTILRKLLYCEGVYIAPPADSVFETTFCDPVYNDILIFKHKNTTTGFIKICFGCGKMVIVGKDFNIAVEAPNKDFYVLEKVIKN